MVIHRDLNFNQPYYFMFIYGLIRLLYYLPMERMTKEELEKLKDFKVYVFEWEVYVKAEDYKKIAIENRELKEVNKKLWEWVDKLTKDTFWVAEENKKLNIKVASLEWEIKWLNSVIDKLKEENQTLELWLDRKEKLNEEYRKELKNYVYDAKQVRDIC